MPDPTREPWQLQQFRYGLKKTAKMRSLGRAVGRLEAETRCLLVTCGDNNGALNYQFRQLGGRWTWAEMEEETIPEMARFLGEEVVHVGERDWPWPEGSFDLVVSIDCMEHLEDETDFLQSVVRATKPGGRMLVTVPEGNTRRLVNRIRYAVGMTPEKYGHHRQGYTLEELTGLMERAGGTVLSTGGYSKFFMEMIELGINAAYVFALSRKQAPQGQIAPASSGELKQHGAAFKVYKAMFPIMKAVAALDHLLPFYRDHAVWVLAERPAPAAA